MSEYPLYPELKEPAAEEAQNLIDKFKEQLKKAAEKAIGNLYCDVAIHIESDSWTNFRNDLMEGFRNYDNKKIQGEFDFKKIREEIYKEYRDEIIADLNQDYINEIADLKQHLKFEKEFNRQYNR